MGLSRFFQRQERDDDLVDEIESYIEHEFDRNVALGMNPADARAAARRKFGSPTRIREASWEMNSVRAVETVMRDLRYALRQLRLSPGFAATAILSLALGIGANTAMFQLLNAVRLRSLPVERPNELAEVKIAGGTHGWGISSWWPAQATYPLWEQIRDHQQAFSGIFAWSSEQITLGAANRRRPADGLWVTGSAFPTLGLVPYRGRLLGPEDDRRGCGSGPVVISHSFWQREWGGRDEAIGAKLIINDHPFSVVGVTPPGFAGLEVGKTFDVALPTCSIALSGNSALSGNNLDRRDFFWLVIVGRLKPDWTMARAAEHLKVIGRALFEAVAPAGYNADTLRTWFTFHLTAEPGGNGISRLRSAYETSLWLLLGITGLVLLIACANLANLLLARASAREREIAVRMSIGASRIRLISQLVTESLLLAVTGGALGAGLALFLSRTLIRFISTERDGFQLNLGADWRMLAFTTTIAVATCLLFGLVPALLSTRVDTSSVMKSGGSGPARDGGRFRFQQVLIASQVSISLVLVTGALLFVNSFRKLTTLDAGFRQEGIVVSFVGFQRLHLPPGRVRPFQEELLAKVRAIPGIQSASTATHTPLDGSSWTLGIRVPGFDGGAGPNKGWSKFAWVRPGYFETIGIPLIAGRDFNDLDTTASRKVIIVNQTFARQNFAGESPIGKAVVSRAEPGYPETLYEIVGVAADVKYSELREEIPPMSYAPDSQNPGWGPFTTIVARTSLPPGRIVSAIQQAIAASGQDIFVRNDVLRQMVEDGLVRERTLAWLSGFFGVLAALLAMIGLYGVISYMVSRRRAEIGIRLALGANRSGVIRLMLGRVAALLVIGLVTGTAVSLAVSRGAESLLFDLKPNDPATLVAAAGVMAVIALAASFAPALRAANADPMAALRQE